MVNPSNNNAVNLTPHDTLDIESFHLPGCGYTPNTSLVHKPLLIYRSAFNFPPEESNSAGSAADLVETHLRSVGVVEPQWRFTMYSRRHFHTTTHEVLVISHGRAKLCFGGGSSGSSSHGDSRNSGASANAHGKGVVTELDGGVVVVECKKGDVIVIPAGVAHCLLEDLDGSFTMVGSYPRGFSWDMYYGIDGEEDRFEEIKKLEWFKKDPIYGNHGPVLT